MTNKYKYGVSFNCVVGRDDAIGGGEEGWTSIDFIGNDLQKVIAAVCKEDPAYVASYDHEYVGKRPDVAKDSGKVVAVILEEDDDEKYVVCVVFTDPAGPEVVE
jgi:hypothetical protein